jgi:DNA-binding MarR family transcriptional regulator
MVPAAIWFLFSPTLARPVADARQQRSRRVPDCTIPVMAAPRAPLPVRVLALDVVSMETIMVDMSEAPRERAKKSSPSPPSALEDHVGYWLRFVSNHVSARFQRLVEAEGVSVSEWVALRQLYGAEVTSAAALMASLGMTKGAISKLVDRLEHKGYARRLPEPEDARAQRIALSRAGRALVPRLARLADENDAHFFAALSPKARRSLKATLIGIAEEHGLKRVPTD